MHARSRPVCCNLIVDVFRYSLDVPLRLAGLDIFSFISDVLPQSQRDLDLQPATTGGRIFEEEKEKEEQHGYCKTHVKPETDLSCSCTDGRPTTAVRHLYLGAAREGWRVSKHASPGTTLVLKPEV